MFLRTSFVVAVVLLAGCTPKPVAVEPASESPETNEIAEVPSTESLDADPPSESANDDEPTATATAPAVRPAVSDALPTVTDTPQATTNESAVDLAPHAAEIEKRLAAAVAKFSREHPNETASLLVFGYSGFNPHLLIAIDTSENSAAFVKRNPDDCGRDEQGSFCNSPYDCAFQLAEYSFKGFPNLYEAEWPLHMKLPGGKVIAVDTGNDAMNEAMLNFLVPILQQSTEYQKLKRAPVFRLGVHAENSHRENFWIPKTANE